MILFFSGLVLLIAGYFIYGSFVERILKPSDAATPAIAKSDGVDYVILPHWKNMLIQLLNIAGIGPVIGVILGVKFGAIVFIIIPIGNIIAGATHDYLSGMMSIRSGGANLPQLIRENLGERIYKVFSLFMVIVLLLVVAVFINIPTSLIDTMLPNDRYFWYIAMIIFAYYVIATMFPVDKIIGALYPFFAVLLLIGTLAIFGALVWSAIADPSLLSESAAFKAGKITSPIVPCLFVTIACGIISGFHATQSPIVARTISSERQAKQAFYGMMVTEGVIAMIWAGAGMAIYNLFPELMPKNPAVVLSAITHHFLGSWMGGVTIIAVIILAITSGDTALRSLRLSSAEILKVDQKPIINRLLICAPLIAVILGILWWSNEDAKSFSVLWNYFAWSNQVLASVTLFAASVWMIKNGMNYFVAIVPAIFMSFIVVSFISWTSPAHNGPVGGGLPIFAAYTVAGAVTMTLTMLTYMKGKKELIQSRLNKK